ncbi:MAG: hydrogenase maturation protease [Anaerolineae bacterium]|nr:hydrogenase maturation protease [Anaerolineae bacterium]
MAGTLILGVGTPLAGDDAVGILAVEELRKRADLPPGVDVIDGGTEGLGLIPVMEQYRRVIVVDAVPMGLPPGTIRRFTWQEVRPVTGARPLSLHQTGLTDALILAETLGSLPAEVVIYGVQPHNMEQDTLQTVIEWDRPLSEPVQRALPALIETLVNEVTLAMAQKILIVDDDPDVVLAARMPLEAAGYEVHAAGTQAAALEAVDSVKPNLIILDVMMDTHTAGFQLAQKLHGPTAPEDHKTIPILMVTAIHQTTPLRFGPDDDYLPVEAFIDKPIDPKALIEKVGELLGG